MPANTSPIFPISPKVSWGTLTTANTAMDGTGTQVTVFTAGSFGARVDKLRIKALGTNVATVLRVFINNGSDATVATNNALLAEKTIAATTASAVAALAEEVLELDVALPAGYKLNVAIGTTVAAGLHVICEGGDF